MSTKVPTGHCEKHEKFDDTCSDCRFARMVMLDSTDVVYPRGIPKRVPRNVCRCPVLEVGDFCPIHGG